MINMNIRPPLASRLIYGVAGGGTAVLFLYATVYGITVQHEPAVTAVPGIVLAGIFVFIGLMGARSNWLRASDATIAYHPTFGSAKVVARDRLAAIVRVAGLKGVSSLQFRSSDREVLFVADASFRRSDVERLAEYLHVPLHWDPE